MGSGNYVNTDQFAYATSGGRTGIRGGLDRAYITAHKNGHVASADILFSE
jgi:hypothetical protein